MKRAHKVTTSNATQFFYSICTIERISFSTSKQELSLKIKRIGKSSPYNCAKKRLQVIIAPISLMLLSMLHQYETAGLFSLSM